VDTAAPDGQPQQTGEPPKERWADILTNARTKAAQEATAQFEAQYGWAKQIDAQEFQSVQQLARTLSANPIEGLQNLIAEIRKDPQYDAALKSLAARALSQRSQQQPAEPQMVQVQLEDGSVITVPRDPNAWLAQQQQQWEAGLDQKLQPLRHTHEQLQAERQAQAQQLAVNSFVSTTYADVQTWPGMDTAEARSTVAKALAQARIDPSDPREVQIALNAAYRTHIVPTLTRAAEGRLLDNLKTNARASTSVNPGSSAPSAPQTITRFDQLPPEAWR
jgi:hypothetical protein